jgi:hypothetical protein
MTGGISGRASQITDDPANDNDPSPKFRKARPDDVRRIFGEIELEHIAEILRSDPTLEELEEAHSWLLHRGDIIAQWHRTELLGMAAVMEFLNHGTDPLDDERIKRKRRKQW